MDYGINFYFRKYIFKDTIIHYFVKQQIIFKYTIVSLLKYLKHANHSLKFTDMNLYLQTETLFCLDQFETLPKQVIQGWHGSIFSHDIISLMTSIPTIKASIRSDENHCDIFIS